MTVGRELISQQLGQTSVRSKSQLTKAWQELTIDFNVNKRSQQFYTLMRMSEEGGCRVVLP